MSNISPENDNRTLSDMLNFVFKQVMKDIWISIPGHIVSYDSSSKRCTVRPAINTVFTDGTSSQPSAIANVPVLWPSGGGFALLFPLPEGSPVEIKFSQRGIEKFKEAFGNTDPGNGFFDKSDAHVIPGYGSISVTPATEDGVSLQSEDGETYIYMTDGNIFMKADTQVTIDTPVINTTAYLSGSALFNGSDSNTHMHDENGLPI